MSATAAWPRTILVTGNMGYVGPAVVRRLRAAYVEATLVGFDAGLFAHSLAGGSVPPERMLDRQCYGDVRSVPAAVLQHVDAVVHLAAVSNDPIGRAYDEVTLAVNHAATVRLARAAKAAGARAFVLASSCSIYGDSREEVVTEESPARPLTTYARSKWLAERELEQLAAEDFTVTSLRFGTACGMSDRLRLDLVLNDFVASAIATRTITILSDGTPWRPLIHVADMGRAVEWAISRRAAAGEAFLAVNTGADHWNYRVRDLAEEVARVIPGVDVSFAASAQPDTRSYRVSFERYRALAPAHQPQLDLRTAVEDVKAGLEGMGFDDAGFRSSRFVRLVALQDLRARGLVNDRLEWTSRAAAHADTR